MKDDERAFKEHIIEMLWNHDITLETAKDILLPQERGRRPDPFSIYWSETVVPKLKTGREIVELERSGMKVNAIMGIPKFEMSKTRFYDCRKLYLDWETNPKAAYQLIEQEHFDRLSLFQNK